MPAHDWPCIVLGVGGVGSAALYHLAAQGIPALGIERFAPGHDRGSSHGETRVIRLAYFEHPAYVPMLREAYARWRALEQASGRRLLHTPGILQIGPPDGAVVQGVLQSARTHNLAVESLSAAQIAERFPGFRVPSGMAGVLEADGGYLDVEDCVRTHADLAVQHGATLWTHTAVTGWRPLEDGGVVVSTDRGEVTAGRLLLSAGAWAADLLPELGLRVVRKTLHWFAPRSEAAYRDTPVFLYDLPEGVFYGFPQHGGALKVAQHSGGAPVPDPLHVDRAVTAADRAPVQAFLRSSLPGVDPEAVLREAVCMYTLSDDGHFRMGAHPRWPQVRYVAGLSGHGFKFAPMLGAWLAQEAPLPSPLDLRGGQ